MLLFSLLPPLSSSFPSLPPLPLPPSLVSHPSPLSHPQAPADHRHAVDAMWGKLASEILMQNWDPALEDLNSLKRRIDDSVSDLHVMVM